MDTDTATKCGLFSWRPKWLQPFASVKFYLFMYSCIGILQGMVYSYINAVLTTMEKQFGLSSKEAAWIYSGNEISQVVFIFLMPFVGKIKKRPLCLGLALFTAGAGMLLMALPAFTSSFAEQHRIKSLEIFEEKPNTLCTGAVGQENTADCRVDDDVAVANKDYFSLVLIFVGMFIVGIGSSFYYVLGLPYGDDNIEKEGSPMLISIVWASRLLGPALGFLIGGFCLKIYVKPWTGDADGFDEKDPRFIGAWWLGFPIIASCLFLVAPWFALFPQRIESQRTDAAKMEREKSTIVDENDDKTTKEYFKDLFKVYKRLISIKLYIFNVSSTVLSIFGIIGFTTFMPKYLEFHFRELPSKAGIWGGLSKTISGVLGCIISGLVVTWLKLGARTLAAYNAICSYTICIIFVALMFVSCPTLEISSLDSEAKSLLPQECNNACHCDSKFRPICAGDGVTNYFSPCHAGCSGQTEHFFSDCSCIELNGTSVWRDQTERRPLAPAGYFDAKEGLCPVNCQDLFFAVIGILALVAFINATIRMPNALLMLRAISPEDKPASMSFIVAMVSLFAFLPSPFIYGAIIDNSCVLWDETGSSADCRQGEGQSLNCLVYDTDKMRYLLNGFTAAALLISALCDTRVFFLAKGLELYDKKSDEVMNGATKNTERETGF